MVAGRAAAAGERERDRPEGESVQGALLETIRRRACLDRLAEIKARQRPLRRDDRFVRVDVRLHRAGKTHRAILRLAWRREGRSLLRINLTKTDPAMIRNGRRSGGVIKSG